jgi:hypothetical protein
VFLVARGVDEGHGLTPALPPEFLDRVLVPSEFGAIALLELVPPGQVMVVPPAQLGAGGEVLDPEIHGGAFLAQPARPKPFDQDSQSVIGSGLLVEPLQPDLRYLASGSSRGQG